MARFTSAATTVIVLGLNYWAAHALIRTNARIPAVPDLPDTPRWHPQHHFAPGEVIPAGIKYVYSPDAMKTVKESFSTGKQLCKGQTPDTVEDAVAVIMIGQPYRIKDFSTEVKKGCGDGSMATQQMLADNHNFNVIRPIEDGGSRVDIFLASSDCWAIDPNTAIAGPWLSNSEEVSMQYRQALHDMYEHSRGRHRTVQMVDLDPNRYQFYHVSQMLEHVKNYTVERGVGYRFVIALRYDMKLAFNMKDIPNEKAARDILMSQGVNPKGDGYNLALNYFMAADDYMFMFPGGFSNCMDQLFTECLAPCKYIDCDPLHGPKQLVQEQERNPKCYEFGALTVKEYMPRTGGYVMPLLGIEKTLEYVKRDMAVKAHGAGAWSFNHSIEECAAFCGNTGPPKTGFTPFYYKIRLGR